MSLSFSNISELRDYVNQFIRENGDNEITGEQHNNVENGLIDFIISSPENHNKATVVASAGNYAATAAQCILVFKPAATGTITLTDNKWNKWTIVNMTASPKALVGAISSYRSVGDVTTNYIAAGSVLVLAKGSDNIWYQAGPSGGGAPATSVYASFNVVVNGGAGMPLDGETTYQNDRFIGATDFTHIVVNGFVEQAGLYFELDNVTGVLTRTNQWARNDVGTFCFNELI